jgi:hypothetical protein
MRLLTDEEAAAASDAGGLFLPPGRVWRAPDLPPIRVIPGGGS